MYTMVYDVAFRTAKQRYTVYFSPFYGTLNENQLLKAQQNQEGDTDIPFTVTVYRFMAQNTMSFFILSSFLRTYVFFLIVAKNARCNKYMSYTYVSYCSKKHGKRNTARQQEATARQKRQQHKHRNKGAGEGTGQQQDSRIEQAD